MVQGRCKVAALALDGIVGCEDAHAAATTPSILAHQTP